MTRVVSWPQLRRPALNAAQFVATRWDDADAKARLGNALLAFIARGMPRSAFTIALYRQLSNMFGFIAHYDEHGFWEEYFSTTACRVRFLEQVDRHPCWGDPTYVWSDVERAVILCLRAHPVLEAYRAAAR